MFFMKKTGLIGRENAFSGSRVRNEQKAVRLKTEG